MSQPHPSISWGVLSTGAGGKEVLGAPASIPHASLLRVEASTQGSTDNEQTSNVAKCLRREILAAPQLTPAATAALPQPLASLPHPARAPQQTPVSLSQPVLRPLGSKQPWGFLGLQAVPSAQQASTWALSNLVSTTSTRNLGTGTSVGPPVKWGQYQPH